MCWKWCGVWNSTQMSCNAESVHRKQNAQVYQTSWSVVIYNSRKCRKEKDKTSTVLLLSPDFSGQSVSSLLWERLCFTPELSFVTARGFSSSSVHTQNRIFIWANREKKKSWFFTSTQTGSSILQLLCDFFWAFLAVPCADCNSKIKSAEQKTKTQRQTAKAQKTYFAVCYQHHNDH